MMSVPSQNKPVVLVVEDEALLRDCVVDQLQDAGFGVIAAANAEQGLQAFDEHGEVTTVFTDMSMPGRFDGLSLMRQVHARRPSVQLILTSGRSAPHRADMPAGVRFLPKPYDCRALKALIRVA